MSSYTIPEASGASIRPRNLIKHKFFPITDFGASEDAAPALNTQAINNAILAEQCQSLSLGRIRASRSEDGYFLSL